MDGDGTQIWSDDENQIDDRSGYSLGMGIDFASQRLQAVLFVVDVKVVVVSCLAGLVTGWWLFNNDEHSVIDK